MNQLFIIGLDKAIKVMEALVDSGYAVRIELFQRTIGDSEFAEFIDRNIYSLIYEITEQQQ
jgi:hypothetical protein